MLILTKPPSLKDIYAITASLCRMLADRRRKDIAAFLWTQVKEMGLGEQREAAERVYSSLSVESWGPAVNLILAVTELGVVVSLDHEHELGLGAQSLLRDALNRHLGSPPCISADGFKDVYGTLSSPNRPVVKVVVVDAGLPPFDRLWSDVVAVSGKVWGVRIHDHP